MILIISHDDDLHTTEVMARLDAKGARTILLDTAHVPQLAGIAVAQDGADWRAAVHMGGAEHDLGAVRAVWWRRPQPYRLHPEITDPDDRTFVYGEVHAAMSGLLACLDATWINDPDRDLAANRKLRQLQVAAAVGLRTPRTCVTSVRSEAEAFVAAVRPGAVIYKPFSATEAAWRETRLLGPAECEALGDLRFAPVIFQEHVPAVADLRVTIVGGKVFAAAIRTAPDGYAYDFRMSLESAVIERDELPAEVELALHRLMDRLGLVYGAIDLRRTPDGDHVFLEVNPAGQWLFTELHTGHPITQRLADHLVELDGRA